MSNSKIVKVFSTTTCPWCTRAKDYLNQKGVKYEDIDVSQDREQAMAMIAKSGSQGVPQLWIGDDFVVGFDQERIDFLLDL